MLTAIAEGMPDALAEVYDRHQSSVYGMVESLCGSGHADEVTHLVFLDLWRSPQEFAIPAGSLLSRLLARAHTHSAFALRRDSATRALEAKCTADELERKLLSPQVPAVQGWLAGLSGAERCAVTLTYFGGYTYQQVAALAQRPEHAVLDDIVQGLRLLKQ